MITQGMAPQRVPRGLLRHTTYLRGSREAAVAEPIGLMTRS